MPDSTPPTVFADVLHLAGNDADHFAQAQFASDVSALAAGHWQWSAWLDARGRVQAFMQLARTGNGELHALLRGGTATALAEALRRYVFRAQIQMQPRTAMALRSGAPLPAHAVVETADGLRLGLGERSVEWSGAGEAAHTDPAWLAADIRDGLPWLPDTALGQLLPPALGLYRLGAVSTGKGCYPGQEIVARLHWHGGHKQHLHRFGGIGGWRAGQHIMNGDASIGLVLAQAGDEALAVIRDEALYDEALPPLLASYES